MPSRVRRCLFAAAVFASPLAFAPSGCASRGPDLAARLGAAKGIYESVGYVPKGSAQSGELAEGAEQRLRFALDAGCYQIVAFAGEGLKGLEIGLLDPGGKPVGEIKRQEDSTSVKTCVEERATYVLVLRAKTGKGPFVAQAYASSERPPPVLVDGDVDLAAASCEGDECDDGSGGTDPCNGAAEILPGSTTKASTAGRPFASSRPSCTTSEGPAQIYRIHVEGRHRLVLDLTAKFDAAVALFRTAHDGYLCDNGYEIDCADDAEGLPNRSHLEATVDTGDYGILVTGYDGDKGDFELRTRLEPAASLQAVCAAARPIASTGRATELASGDGSNFRASCASADGAEALFKFDVKARSRVRLSMRSGGGESSLSVRRRCDDASSEILCAKDWHFDGLGWTGSLDAGAYTLIADTSDPGHAGPIDVQIDTAQATGGGVDGDACKDAKPLVLGSSVLVDTFAAKADVRASCADPASADVVHKIDVKSRSRVQISATEDEGRHVLSIQKSCGDPKTEVACDLAFGKGGVDALLDPGAYFVVLKGRGAEDFGRARITSKVRELAPAAAACKAAPKLSPGVLVNDTTLGAADRFASERCGGGLWTQTSGDKVYQFTLKEKSRVNLALKGATFYNAIMSLRADCGDPTKGELACSNTYSKVIDRELEKGTYYVVVDGFGTKSEGTFALELTTKPVK